MLLYQLHSVERFSTPGCYHLCNGQRRVAAVVCTFAAGTHDHITCARIVHITVQRQPNKAAAADAGKVMFKSWSVQVVRSCVVVYSGIIARLCQLSTKMAAAGLIAIFLQIDNAAAQQRLGHNSRRQIPRLDSPAKVC